MNKPPHMPYPLVSWSERGVVNALVGYLRQSPQRVATFLRACAWFDTNWSPSSTSPEAVLTLIQELNNPARHVAVTFIVESSFADFGSPDLIVTVHSPTLGTQVIFVEAKATPYLQSAKSNLIGMRSKAQGAATAGFNKAQGVATAGFNSSINGQLALKYRLSQALAHFDPTTEELVEPHWIRFHLPL